VEALDRALGKKKLRLSRAPDGFGDATVGSMIANDTAAGLGMFEGPVSELVEGVRAVLGTGEILATGAFAGSVKDAALSRTGLPDQTGLLLGAEGALGIVVEAALRVDPLPRVGVLRLRMGSSLERFRKAVKVARRLAGSGIVDSFLLESWVGMRPDDIRIECSSAVSGEDLERRLSAVKGLFEAEGLDEPDEEDPQPRRWQARPAEKEGWMGVSTQLPFEGAEKAYALWVSHMRGEIAAVASPEGFLRTYLGARACASLFGWSHPYGVRPDQTSAKIARRLRSELGSVGLPYRAGTVWRSALRGRLGREYLSRLEATRREFDPDAILNPGVGVFGLLDTPQRRKR